MATKLQRKLKRYWTRKWRRNKKSFLFASVIVAILSLVFYNNYMQDKRLAVDTKSYSSLLELIAQAESKDNYNAYYGNPANTEIIFTDMTIEQIMQWQADFINQGAPSSAVGRYQIINTTLSRLVQETGIDLSQKFDQNTQDQLAIALLEHRGSENYINKEITHHEFAANLAKEWAALPRVTGGDPASSYYAGDGLNRSLVAVDEVLNAIEHIQPKNI